MLRVRIGLVALLAASVSVAGSTSPVSAEPSGASPGTPRGAAATIAAGAFHTCARLANGTVKCWGDGDFGRLGQGGTDTLGDDPGEMGDDLDPVDLGTGRTATAITASGAHTCALLDDATIKCWGFGGPGGSARATPTTSVMRRTRWATAFPESFSAPAPDRWSCPSPSPRPPPSMCRQRRTAPSPCPGPRPTMTAVRRSRATRSSTPPTPQPGRPPSPTPARPRPATS